MKQVILLVTIASCIISATPVHGQQSAQSRDTLVQRLGETFIREKGGVGLSIGIYKNGVTSFYNFGSTKKDALLPPNPYTVYEIGSLTKTFVSYVLAQAVLEHKVSLNDDVRKYLKGNYPNLEYRGQPIRMVHLANTTSLLPDYLPEPPEEMKNLAADSALALKIKTYKKLTRNDLFAALQRVKLDTVPGTRRYHSNAGAQLLAYILEDVYRQPMESLIKKYITAPNHMQGTSFVGSKKNHNLATGYNNQGKESAYEFEVPYFKNDGGLGSTSHDLVEYIRLLLDKTNPASVLCLRKTVDIDASSGKIVQMRPEGTAAPEVYSAGLNWFSYQPEATYRQIWSDGGTNGFNSYLVIYPYSNSGVILLSNKSDEKIFRSLPALASQLSKAMN